MLLSDRRVAFLQLLLAAMQASWIAPFFALAWHGTPSPWTAFAVAFGGLVAWVLVLELLSRKAETPLYDALALGLLVVVSLLLVRLVLYRGGLPWDLSWIGRSLADTVSWTGGLPPALVLVGANVLLWQRAAAATSRELNFFGVGVAFRSGLLLLLLGGALLTSLREVAPLGLLWLYLALGLSAVAISRISEKASETQSYGQLLPPRRFVQTLAAAAGAIGVIWLVSRVYTGTSLGSLFRLLAPLWELVRPLVLILLLILERLISPVFLWLERLLSRMLGGVDTPPGAPVLPAAGAEAGPSPLDRLPAWLLEWVANALVIVTVAIVLFSLAFFLLLYLERVRRTGLQKEPEDEQQERATFGGGILGRTLDSLRNAAALIRRFGVGRDLLAAISVQNIYANLCRIARQEGKPRLPSQPPDAYLPVLAQVFPSEEECLQRITAAYMRVHYGDHPVQHDELAALREDYRRVREAQGERLAAAQPPPAAQ